MTSTSAAVDGSFPGQNWFLLASSYPSPAGPSAPLHRQAPPARLNRRQETAAKRPKLARGHHRPDPVAQPGWSVDSGRRSPHHCATDTMATHTPSLGHPLEIHRNRSPELRRRVAPPSPSSPVWALPSRDPTTTRRGLAAA